MGGARLSYVKDADRYIIGVMRDLNIVDEYERITPIERAWNTSCWGMRTARGIEGGEYTLKSARTSAPGGDAARVRGEGLGVQDGRGPLALHELGFALEPADRRALEAQSGSRVAVNP